MMSLEEQSSYRLLPTPDDPPRRGVGPPKKQQFVIRLAICSC